jgi:CRP/FNR family transcriptional regulator, cyclic AMP receptor protein
MDEARVAAVPLFASLSKRERGWVAQHADEVDVREGKTLLNEGAFAYEFFLITDGTAEVVRGEAHVADLGPGDFFGEMGSMADAARTATVVTTSPMTAIVMSAQDLRRLAQDMPGVADRLGEAIEERNKALD